MKELIFFCLQATIETWPRSTARLKMIMKMKSLTVGQGESFDGWRKFSCGIGLSSIQTDIELRIAELTHELAIPPIAAGC